MASRKKYLFSSPVVANLCHALADNTSNAFSPFQTGFLFLFPAFLDKRGCFYLDSHFKGLSGYMDLLDKTAKCQHTLLELSWSPIREALDYYKGELTKVDI